MNIRTDAIYVIGHKNPDTDAIASAMGYAWLRQNRDEETTIAARAGSINAQTKFALDYFGLQPPFLLEDAAPRFFAHRAPRNARASRPPAERGMAIARQHRARRANCGSKQPPGGDGDRPERV